MLSAQFNSECRHHVLKNPLFKGFLFCKIKKDEKIISKKTGEKISEEGKYEITITLKKTKED